MKQPHQWLSQCAVVANSVAPFTFTPPLQISCSMFLSLSSSLHLRCSSIWKVFHLSVCYVSFFSLSLFFEIVFGVFYLKWKKNQPKQIQWGIFEMKFRSVIDSIIRLQLEHFDECFDTHSNRQYNRFNSLGKEFAIVRIPFNANGTGLIKTNKLTRKKVDRAEPPHVEKICRIDCCTIFRHMRKIIGTCETHFCVSISNLAG